MSSRNRERIAAALVVAAALLLFWIYGKGQWERSTGFLRDVIAKLKSGG